MNALMKKTASIICPVVLAQVVIFQAQCSGDDKESRPLAEAVATLNERLLAYPFEEEGIRTPALSNDERPHLLTVDEVLTAIREWDRDALPIDDYKYSFFEEIVLTKMLPPRSSLRFYEQWDRPKSKGRIEYRELRIDLVVMTGEKSGYGFRVRTQHLDERPYLELSPGYSWIVHPASAEPADWNAGGIVYKILEDADSALHVIAATLVGNDVDDLRGVAFDKNGRRYELERTGVGHHENMVMLKYKLPSDVVATDALEFFGIEGLSRRGMLMLSREATRKAADRGLHVLPLPVVGEKLEFTLKATDGQSIDSSKLLGKVVIIDCWASWCGPCIEQLPDLMELRKRFGDAELAIIGLSIDEDPQAAVELYASAQIEWPLVTLPEDEESRQLWQEAARIQLVPRILMIDSSGTLQFDGAELPLDRVQSLLRAKKSPAD